MRAGQVGAGKLSRMPPLDIKTVVERHTHGLFVFFIFRGFDGLAATGEAGARGPAPGTYAT